MKVFLIILATLLVYNLFGAILYFKEKHSRIVSGLTIIYLVGAYFPVVYLIELVIYLIEMKKKFS